MPTMKVFVDVCNIKVMDCIMVSENPYMPDFQGNNYKVKLSSRLFGKRREMTVFFSMGYAHQNEPTSEEILDCLAIDAASIDNCGSFEEWASDLGYDPDSRKAEKTFKACEREAKKLKQFLGLKYFDLLYRTDRL